jgi:flavin reductase (DIM6/NTAB) family NADH-FMN oxidoreductase RutF
MDKSAKEVALKKLQYGVAVVGVAGEGHATAFSCSWAMQCSFRPPLVTVAARKGTRGRHLIEVGMAFSLNFLGKDGQTTAQYFFDPPERDGDKLGDVPFKPGEATGMPIIDGAIASLECQVIHILDVGGDHDLVVGKVLEAQVHSDEPPLALSDTPWNYGG